MISVINVPTEEPKDFYASRQRYLTEPPCHSTETTEKTDRPTIDDNNNKEMTTKIPKIKLSKPTSWSIFYRRKTAHNTKFLSDGRKVYDGKVVVPASASKLWKQLIVRTVIHKMEDEIHDPVEQISKMNDSLPKLSKDKSVSTYSLVSQNRLKSECDKCTPYNKPEAQWREIAKSSTNLCENAIPSSFCTESSLPEKITKKQTFLTPNGATKIN